MISRYWTDATHTEQEELKQWLHSHKEVLDTLKEICYNVRDTKEKSRIKQPDYTSAAWPYVQADLNGYLRCLEDMQRILTIEEE